MRVIGDASTERRTCSYLPCLGTLGERSAQQESSPLVIDFRLPPAVGGGALTPHQSPLPPPFFFFLSSLLARPDRSRTPEMIKSFKAKTNKNTSAIRSVPIISGAWVVREEEEEESRNFFFLLLVAVLSGLGVCVYSQRVDSRWRNTRKQTQSCLAHPWHTSHQYAAQRTLSPL